MRKKVAEWKVTPCVCLSVINKETTPLHALSAMFNMLDVPYVFNFVFGRYCNFISIFTKTNL